MRRKTFRITIVKFYEKNFGDTEKLKESTDDNFLGIHRGSGYTESLRNSAILAMRRPTMENEMWKDVIGYKGIYAVSNLGRVMRLKSASGTRAGTLLEGTINSHGYRTVNLYRDGIAKIHPVHRLVASAFIGEPHVNHKDGNKENNQLNNLEYVDSSGNLLHAYHHLGRQPSPSRGQKSGGAVLSDEIVRHIRELDRQGQTSNEINQIYPMVKRAQIRKVVRRAAWAHIE